MAIAAAPFSYLLMVTLLYAISFDLTMLWSPAEFISIGPDGAVVFTWTMLGDVVGQYLLLLPLIVFLWYWLAPRDPLLVTLLTVLGIMYVIVGAVGVSINAAVLPPLMVEYATAGAERRALLETVFGAVATATMVGMWGIAARLLGGLYWIGIGWVVLADRPRIGALSIVVGLFALLSVLGNVLAIGPVIGVGTLGYLLGFPLWALWLGIVLYRKPSMSPVERPDRA